MYKNNVSAIIVAAGSQTRFKSDTPKALVNIGNRSLLEKNIESLELNGITNINVICSTENYEKFLEVVEESMLIKVKCGTGSGNAIIDAIKSGKIDSKYTETLILWGDSIYNKDAIREFLSYVDRGYDVNIPVILEEYPYVQIVHNDKMELTNIKYSNKGDTIDRWSYHDLSFFYVKDIFDTMNFYIKNKKEKLDFLEVVLEKKTKVIKLCNIEYASYSFNTVEEYEKIKEKIYEN